MKTNAAVLNTWRGLRKWSLAATLLALLSTAGTVRAQVTNVIYQDTFARSGLLNGSSPDTANVTGAKYIAGPLVYTGNWTDQNGNTEDACYFSNSIPAVQGPLYNVAYLPITVQTGHVYTLTASILVNTNYGTWWMFLAYASTPSLAAVQGQWTAGMLIRSTNNPYGNGNAQAFNGPGTTGGTTYNWTPSGTPWNPRFITFTSVLNLANPAAPAEYWYTNGVAIKTNFPTSLSSVGANNGMWPHFITFGQSGCAGYVTNFSFTDVVPVPSMPTILEQPNSLAAPQGQSATFWVSATAAPDPTYQWMSNNGTGWVNIPGATNATYTTPTLSSAYNGLQYSVTVSNVVGPVTSSAATLTVTAGNPTVYSVTKTTSPTSLVVNFSGAVEPTTSRNAANYTLNHGASVSAVSAGSVPGSVVLTTSTLDPNADYYLTVRNVQDLVGNPMAGASTNVVLPAGLVLDLKGDSGVQVDASGNVVQWLDQTTNGNHASQFFGWSPSTSGLSLPGTTTRPTTSTTINGLTTLTFNAANSTFLEAAPTPSISINTNLTIYCVAKVSDVSVNRHLLSKNVGNIPASFELDANNNGGQVQPNLISGAAGVGNVGVNVGAGSIAVPHVFAATRAFVTTYTNAWTAGLSFPPAQTNWFYTASNTVSLYLDGVQTRTNAPVNEGAPGLLDGQQPLYIGTRQDHYTGDIMNGQIAEILVFDTPLSAADMVNVDNYLGQKWFNGISFLTAVPSITTSNGFAVTISPGPFGGSTHIAGYQWLENGTNLPGATASSYTTPILAPGDNGDTFSLVVTLNSGVSYTNTTTLIVLNEPPYVTSAGIPVWSTAIPTSILVVFDEAVDPVTATVAANYSLDSGASVLSAAMGDAPNQVVLTTSPLTWNASPAYTLTVQNVKDVYGNTMMGAAPSVGLYPPNLAVWVRADSGVTTDAGANTVNQWNDLSGNNNHFYAGSGTPVQPQLVTNAWGDPVVRFNATDTVTNYMIALSSSTLGITGDMSVIAVINSRTLASGRNGHILSKTGNPNRNIAAPYDYLVGNTAGLLRGNGNGTANGVNYGVFSATSAPSVGYPNVVAVSETGNTVSHYLNGKAVGTGLLSNNYQEANDYDLGQQVYIGARSDGYNRLAGDLAELLVTTSPLSSSDMATVANHLSARHHFVLFNPSPANIAVSSLSNHSQLTLTWPADRTGWQLQSNAVGLQATGAWFTVSGAASTNQITITPNASQTNVFYRMFFQQP